MAESSWAKRVGATPGKLALFALMAGVLIYVLAVQFGGEEATTVAPREARRAKLRRQERRATAVMLETPLDDQNPSAPAKKPWPLIPKSEIVRHDPFTLPPALAMPLGSDSSAADETSEEDRRRDELERKRRQTLIELEKKGVNVVVLGETVQAAFIGDKTVQVGDVFDGFRVAEIGRNGVLLIHVEDEVPSR